MASFVDCSSVTDPYRDMQIPVDCNIRANFCCNIRSRNNVRPKLSFRKTGPYSATLTSRSLQNPCWLNAVPDSGWQWLKTFTGQHISRCRARFKGRSYSVAAFVDKDQDMLVYSIQWLISTLPFWIHAKYYILPRNPLHFSYASTLISAKRYCCWIV